MPAAAETIPELFQSAAAAVPGQPWLFAGDTELTYAQAHERIGRAGAALADLGVGRGDLVFATTRNTPEYLLTWLATTSLGAIFVPARASRGGRS